MFETGILGKYLTNSPAVSQMCRDNIWEGFRLSITSIILNGIE